MTTGTVSCMCAKFNTFLMQDFFKDACNSDKVNITGLGTEHAINVFVLELFFFNFSTPCI